MKLKLIITTTIILFSLTCFSQQKKDTTLKVKDSTLRVIVSKTSIDEFQTWLYDKITAKAFNEFAIYYNAFVEYKYQQSLKEKPKTTK